MNKIFLVVAHDYQNKNTIFNNYSPENRDNQFYPSYVLRKKFYESNILLNTYDYLDKNKDDNYSLMFMALPNNINEYIDKYPSIEKYLVTWECEVISPITWDISLHKYFKKVFTWNDNYIDNKKYFKINLGWKIPTNLDFRIDKKSKFCTIIAGNKFINNPLELYSERVKAIHWFEQNHPEDFDLFGVGWDKYFDRRPFRKLNRLKFLKKVLKPKYPSYRGKIQSKKEILEKYKYSICYENAKDIPGYITEKIFDCFFSGCVPIYLGAPNIADYIPKNTFIDRRLFNNYEELYKYLKTMSENEYNNYLNNIREYLLSDEAYQFSSECYAETIVREITKGL